MDFSATPTDYISRRYSVSSFQFTVATAFSALTVIILVTALASSHIEIAVLPLSNRPRQKSEVNIRSALNLHHSLDLVLGKSPKNIFPNFEHREEHLYSSNKLAKSLPPPWKISRKMAAWASSKSSPSQILKMLHTHNTYHSHKQGIQKRPVSALNLS